MILSYVRDWREMDLTVTMSCALLVILGLTIKESQMGLMSVRNARQVKYALGTESVFSYL